MTVPTVWGWVLGHSLREQPDRGQVLGTSHPEARAPRQNPSSAFLHNLIKPCSPVTLSPTRRHLCDGSDLFVLLLVTNHR